MNDIKESNKSDEEKLRLTYGLLQTVFENTYEPSYSDKSATHLFLTCNQKDWKVIKKCMSDFHRNFSDTTNLVANTCKSNFLEFAKGHKKYSDFIKNEDSKWVQNRNKLFDLAENEAYSVLMFYLNGITKPKDAAERRNRIKDHLGHIKKETDATERLKLFIGLREVARKDPSGQIKNAFNESDRFIDMQYQSHLVDRKAAEKAFLDWKKPKHENNVKVAPKPGNEDGPQASLMPLHKVSERQRQETDKTGVPDLHTSGTNKRSAKKG